MPPHVRIHASVPPPDADQRYELRDLIGEGGMGEVHVCRDRRIGRDVAIKVIRADGGAGQSASRHAEAVARFEREAKVQGQLEHPSVVPVYDMGTDASGRSYFTMKRLRGRTLADVLDGLRRNDPEIEAEFTRRRLLVAFSQICFAVAFAHSRGVLHRDIKPENVMFGDFGEIHLLDWGIATVVDDLRETGREGQRKVVEAEIEATHKTLAGEMVGTPGYMAPEQIEGDPQKVDERADVFGLGAVLFEILTLESLVPGETLAAIMTATMVGVDARAAARAPERDIPPELEHACIRATAPLPDRYRSARELRDEVERYLEGDRDVATRTALADARVAEIDVMASEIESNPDNLRARADALRGLAAAVALDPSNQRAQALLGRLLLAGPKQLPTAAREALDARRSTRRTAVRKVIFLVSLIFLLAPLFVVMLGVRDARYLAIIIVANILVPLCAFYSLWRKNDTWSPVYILISAMLAAGAGSFLFGPLIHVPSNVLAISVVFASQTAPRLRRLALPAGIITIVLPLLLALTGVLPSSYALGGGTFEVLPIVARVDGPLTISYLTGITLTALVLTCLLVMRQQRVVDDLEEKLFLHAWNLQHLVPQGADVALAPRSVPEPPAHS